MTKVPHRISKDGPAATESFVTLLYEITSNPESSLEGKVGELLALGCDQLGLEVGILSKIVGSSYEVVNAHDPNGVLAAGPVFSLGRTFCEHTVASIEPIGFTRTNDKDAEQHPAYGTATLKSYLGVSVIAGGLTFGTLNFSSPSPRPDPFTEQEFTIVRLMAQWIAYELVRKRSEDVLHRKDQQLERLLLAANRINTDLDIDRILKEVVDSAVQVLDCRYAALGVYDPGTKKLKQFVTTGLTEEEVDRLGAQPTGRGLLGLVMDKPHPLRVVDISEHAQSVGFPPNHPKMTTFLGVPIHGRDGPIGNLYCTNKNGDHQFTKEDESAAEVLAAEAAIAIENARLLAELRMLQVSRNRFYAMVNHELRNALTGVYGWAELLARKAGDDPPRAVRETLESAEYALELLNDLLDLSRLDADRIEPAVAEANGLKIMRDAVATVQPSARDYGVSIQIVGDEELPCRTDAKRVRQILVNLLRNAVKHSGDDAIIIEAQGDQETLEFAVVDHGEGISADQQTIIFDAYSRASAKAGGGTGLGLTLSRRLAVVLGGDISVRSQLGKGARFTVQIARYLA